MEYADAGQRRIPPRQLHRDLRAVAGCDGLQRGSAVRDDVSGPGTWAFLPAQLADGNTVVVNTGFVQNTMQDRNQQDRAVAG
jgi:hypothetical protein